MVALALLVTVTLVWAKMPSKEVAVILPELVTLAALAIIPYWPPVTVAPALLVTVAPPTLASMPYKEVPVMLPELVILAAPLSAEIPIWPPVMLPPVLLVTVALVPA